MLNHDSVILTPKDGVRHISDPERKVPELMENGAWDYTEDEKEAKALVGEMRNAIAECHKLRTELHKALGK